jgi:hypothetical protein
MTILTSKAQYLSFKQSWAKAANNGKLCNAHHLLYNIIMERELTTGFTPRTNVGRIQATEGGTIHGLWHASHVLGFILRDESLQDVHLRSVFGSELTALIIDQVKSPEFQPLPFNYGLGKKVFDKIKETSPKTLTFDQLWEILNDEAA